VFKVTGKQVPVIKYNTFKGFLICELELNISQQTNSKVVVIWGLVDIKFGFKDKSS